MEVQASYYSHLRTETRHLWPQHIQHALEIGCGSGRLAEILPCKQYWGVEPHNESAQLAADKHGYRIINSTFDEAVDKLPKAYFDLVICHDSIEHLPDHEWFFSQLPGLCQASAQLILTVPNARHISVLKMLFIEKDWKYQASGIMDSTHLRWFTEKSLRCTLEEHDYVITAFERLGVGIPSPNLLKRTAARIVAAFLGQDLLARGLAVRATIPT
jgi:2-polyprenyl-3-methyl-5-hydroxy-6-metoxy-1,4-benzoquinol methylase